MMLLEQCRPLHGGRLVRMAFCGCAHFWAPIATRRLPERWNDVSGGRSRTGPAFCGSSHTSLGCRELKLKNRPYLRPT